MNQQMMDSDRDQAEAETSCLRVEVATLQAELAKFEPHGTGKFSTLDSTPAALKCALIGWHGRALAAERKLAEAYCRLRELDLRLAEHKLETP